LEQGLLKYKKGRWYISPEVAYPADEVNIRSASINNYIIVVKGTGMVLEIVEENTAFSYIHAGAVYLHQGESYLITDLDIEARTAYAVLSNIDYYTQTIEKTDLRIVEVQQQSKIGGIDVYRGWVRVSSTVIGYRRKARITEEVLSEEVLDLPCQSFNTSALWFNIPDSAINKIQNSRIDLAGGLHAAEHAAIGLLPLFALCDRADIGGLSTLLHPDTGQAQVFIYDGYPGGIGITEKGFELIYELWEATLATIEECPCQAGCPSCIQSPKCGNNNEPLDKTAAKYILEDLIEFGRVVAS
jgi:DEAD/DEAH box helicase domain-containing protein